MKLSTRLTLAMIALVLFTAAAVGVLSDRNIAAVTLPHELNRIDTRARLAAVELEASVRAARADVMGFRSAVAVDGIVRASLAGGVHPAEFSTVAQWRSRLATRFTAELASKPDYAQFRVIGVADGGRELVRVDRSGPDGGIRVVPDSELRRSGDHDYFQRVLRLAAGEVDISPVDLNRENGVIETPHVPTIRATAPVFAPDGQLFGMMTIHVDLRPAFERIRSMDREDSDFYVVNERGDYLVHPDRSREFGFELSRPIRIQDDFPELGAMLTAGETLPRVVKDRAGERFGIGWEAATLTGGPKVYVIEAVPYTQVFNTSTAVRNASLLGGFTAALGAIMLAVFIARPLTRPLVQMTAAVEGLARDEGVSVPTDAYGEIGVLARAFARMRNDVHEKTAALKQEIEERRRIFDTSPDLILITDRHGKFIRVSPSAAAILGYQPDEMIAHSAADFIHPDDLESTREELRLARRGRHVRNFETRYAHKGGHFVTLVWNGVWSEDAQQHFFIGRDMTESKLAEEAIIDSERMARGIIDTALDGFIQMDERGQIIDWNPQAEAIFGWSRDEAIGRMLCDLIVPETHRARHTEGLARFLRSGESAILGKRLEIEALCRDGREIKVELSVTALRRRSEYVFNGFIRDLTEKIAAEEQFRHAQKMEAVGQLTGGIAHDFNNMLTVITGTIEILEDAVADRPELAAIAQLIGEAADRGAELTGHLLAFARKQPLQPRKTDINALMVEAERLLRPALGEHVEIALRLEENPWPVLIDPPQLTTALLNLAVNARDAMPNGGKLILETSNVMLDESYANTNSEVQPGNYVMIAVSDTGAGIPEAVLAKVFEPFFTTKEVGKGTGLGLSMVYGFVKQSGGHIQIYSEEGHGTTIKIYLPQADAHAERSERMADAPSVEGGSETVLVVEDDKLVRSYVTAQLQSLGYETLSVANAAEALAIADSGAAFDLLFTDVIMPGSMNGRQLADEMAKRRWPVKALFTSGYTENALIHHGRLDAGVLLLGKPYRKADLARMVRIALDAAPASQTTATMMGNVKAAS